MLFFCTGEDESYLELDCHSHQTELDPTGKKYMYHKA